MERVNWPRSVFKTSILLEAIDKFKYVKDEPNHYIELFDEYKDEMCWRPSSKYNFDATSQRNRRSMRKGAALPEGGKKRDALQGAIQYNEHVVKPSNNIDKCWSDVSGYRTQQSEPGDEKVRLVFMKPAHMWVMEGEALDDSIDQTVIEAQKLSHRFQVFYFDARTGLKEWMNKYISEVTHWVYIDATSYDTAVQNLEISACWTLLAPQYEFRELLIQHTASADLITPGGIVHRNGGMSSGGKITNPGDGLTNLFDHLECLRQLRLLRYLECVLINGDDITFGFSTHITDENLRKWANISRRDVSPDKSIKFDDALVNSKWWCDGSILTRSIFRAINSLAFAERESSALSANAVYVAIARHQILLDVEEHPLFEVLAKELAKYEEYPLKEAQADPRWAETLEYYFDTHDYMGNIDSTQFVTEMEQSRYATEFAV
jgi:hypothetical protein